jgi:hypothetical protein
MGRFRFGGAAAISFAALVGGCGAVIPSFGEFYDTVPPEFLVDAIVGHVHCEVKSQVQFLILDDYDRVLFGRVLTGKPLTRRLTWLDDWAAQVTLTLTVDEKSTISPGVTLNTVLPNAVSTFSSGNVTTPQSSSVALGASGSVDGTRKGIVSWYIDFREFTKDPMKLAAARRARDKLYADARAAGTPTVASPCNKPRGVLIEGDIGFREWLYMTLKPAFVEGGVTGDFAEDLKNEIKISKKDALQNQVTFVVQYSGNVTPSWKLLRVSANPTGPFLSAQRTRTQDLAITLGPAPDDAKVAGMVAAQNQALATAIGNAVASAIRSGPPQ